VKPTEHKASNAAKKLLLILRLEGSSLFENKNHNFPADDYLQPITIFTGK